VTAPSFFVLVFSPARTRQVGSYSTPYGGSVTIRLGRIRSSTRSTSVFFVLSPHSRRCRPSSNRSPRLIGVARGTGMTSGSVSPSVSPASARTASSSSAVQNGARSKPSSSSSCSASGFHVASSPGRLSNSDSRILSAALRPRRRTATSVCAIGVDHEQLPQAGGARGTDDRFAGEHVGTLIDDDAACGADRGDRRLDHRDVALRMVPRVRGDEPELREVARCGITFL
jgi:hypothetical protein